MAKITKVSPLAPESFPKLPEIKGVQFSTVAAGVRYQGRTDVMLAKMVPGTSVAGVFTRSATRSAPVLDCQSKLGGEVTDGAAILVNSGNSNAFTGRNGVDAVAKITQAVADACQVPEARVFTASTGVIGEPLPFERITSHLHTLAGNLSPGGMEDAARAIMTTDTFPKGAGAEVERAAPGEGVVAAVQVGPVGRDAHDCQSSRVMP